MKHIIAVLLENEPGALSRVVALFSAGYILRHQRVRLPFDEKPLRIEAEGGHARVLPGRERLERAQGRLWENILLPGGRIPNPSVLRTHPLTADRVARLMALKAASAHATVGHPIASSGFASSTATLRA